MAPRQRIIMHVSILTFVAVNPATSAYNYARVAKTLTFIAANPVTSTDNYARVRTTLTFVQQILSCQHQNQHVV